MTSTMKVDYQGDYVSLSGYARATRNHVKALLEAGVDVAAINAPKDRLDNRLDAYWLSTLPELLSKNPGSPVRIQHETPEFYIPHPAQYNIAMLTFETDTIPNYDVDGNPRNNWVKQLNKMDEIWTFSSFMKEVFYNSGVKRKIPVHIFPHPIDLEKYQPGPGIELYDVKRRILGDDWFKFVASFQWSKRKNPYVLLAAFMSEFSAEEKVCLVIKTYGPDFSKGSKNMVVTNLVNMKRFFRNPKGLPRIFLQLEKLADEEVPAFMQSADVGVSTAYGEGFGLPIQEFMACGIPVIVPEASSFPDFVREDETGWLVKTYPTPVLGMTFKWYESYMKWWEIDVCHLMEKMRQAYNCADRLQKGRSARAFVEDHHSFEAVGKAMRARLEEIYDGL